MSTDILITLVGIVATASIYLKVFTWIIKAQLN